MLYCPGNTLYQHVHRSRCTEHADAHEDCHEIRDDFHCRGKTFLRSLDESIIYIHFLPEACQDEAEDDAEQNHVRSHGGDRVHRVLVHLSESPDDNAHKGAHSDERAQEDGLEDVDALPERRDDDAGERCHKGSQEDRDEDIRWLGGTIRGSEGEDGGRDDGETGGVQDQEHNHRVRCRILLGVEFLHLLHRLQSCRSRCIVKSEHVGGDVHENATHHRVVLRDVGEEFGEDRAERTSQHIHYSRFLSNLHDAEPEGEHARESERNLEGILRRVEGGIHYLLEDGCISHCQSDECEDERNYEEGYPNVI